VIDSSVEIAKLCESWWGKLVDRSKPDQRAYAVQLLALLGWQQPVPIEPKPGLAQMSPIGYVLHSDAQVAIAAHFVLPGTLEPPSVVVERGLDFCEATRLLVNESRVLKADYTLITDLHRSYFYDTRTDELLLYADAPGVFRREFAPLLTRAHIERGSLDEIRRQPRSQTARHLREWCQRWCATIVDDSYLPEEDGFLAIDRLLALRYLFEHDILKRTGWYLRKRFSGLIGKAFSNDPRGCGRLLRGLFHDIGFDWKASLFAPVPALDAVIEKDAIAIPLLKEFSLHTRTKFSIATILESFNYGDAAEKARVRMVPDVNEERDLYLAKQTVDTIDNVHIELDLADEGYRAIFHWFDKLVDLYTRLETDFDTRIESTVGPDELDLFAWSEIAAKRPKALADKFQHAVEHGLTLYYSTPRQLRTARLMLYLHIISSYDQTKQRFTQFPKTDTTFKLRPKVLDIDRKWIYQSPAEDDTDAWFA